jgi:hypothetical protein
VLHSIAWDAARGRVVLFGGRAPGDGPALSDTWFYDGADWTPAPAGAAPPPRHSAALAYDAARDRLVLFGGRSGFDALDDTWQLGPTGWAQASPTTPPPETYGAGMTYDPHRRVVTLYDDAGATWDFDGHDWEGPAPAAPGQRSQAALAFHPGVRGLALFGGASSLGSLGDLWSLDRHQPTSAYAAHQAVFALDARATLIEATVTWAGAARGAPAGAAGRGLALLAWDWDAGQWVGLGTTSAAEAAAGAIQAALPGDAARFCRHGRVVVLAAPIAPSSEPGETVRSEIWTDLAELRVTYELP